MRQIMLSIVLAALLAGCAKQADQTAQLINLAKSQCHFIIDYASAEKIIAASADAAGGNGFVTGVVNIANAVCAAVQAPPGTAMTAVHQCPMVNGVCVTGSFESKP